jgi:hypothetical protein
MLSDSNEQKEKKCHTDKYTETDATVTAAVVRYLKILRQLSMLLFVDDQVIIADTEDTLQKATHKLN